MESSRRPGRPVDGSREPGVRWRRPTPVEPPYAALELHRDQVRAGVRTFRVPGALARDRFEVAADWERRALAARIGGRRAAFARIARASLIGKSPRTRRGHWRRDLAYLEAIEAEARATLPAASCQRYARMVADWREREPHGIMARYKALRNRQRQQAESGGEVSE